LFFMRAFHPNPKDHRNTSDVGDNYFITRRGRGKSLFN
jgi:hypothetical protein